MAETLEERVAYLEGKVEEQSRLGSDVRERLVQLDQKVDRFREELLGVNAATNSRIDATNDRIDALDQRLSSRLDATNDRIDALDQRLSSRLDALDQRLSSRLDALDQRLSSRLDAIDQKLSTQFRWLVGIMVAVLLAVIGVLLRSGPS